MRAIVTAAGLGARLGEDKALAQLAGRSIVERIVDRYRSAGVEDVVVVRRHGAPELPALDARVVACDPPEMIDSVRAGLAGLDPRSWFVVHPVDYPLAADGVAEPLVERCATTTKAIVVAECFGRRGHPLALRASLAGEVFDPAVASLREVVRRDPDRVEGLAVVNPWILRDIDEPHDLVAARAFVERPAEPITATMRRHRSRRSYRPDDVPDAQLEWIVDSARFAATSSMMQAYAVVAVRDATRRARIAALCADQRHIREAPVFLAICADLHKIELACERHGADLQADSIEVFLQAVIDASIFGQNIQLAAESEGLGACMIGAARNHPVELAELLGLPPHVAVAFGMTVGWPADDPVPRGRMPLGAVLHADHYDAARLRLDLDAADAAMRSWARETNATRGGYAGRPVDEERGWTDRMARLWGSPKPLKGRADLVAALRRLGFGLRTD